MADLQSTPIHPVATTAASPRVNPAGLGSTRRPSARTGLTFESDPSALGLPEFDGSDSDFPLIPNYVCAECGAQRPGAGVNRQSQAMIATAHGPIRRGGKCRTCRRVALAAQQAFQTTTARYMQQHGAGLDYQARKAVLQDALRDARLAMWRVFVSVAQRAATRADRRAA